VKGSRIPFQPDRPSNVVDRNLVFADLASNHAEKMERIGMMRGDGENLPINLFGNLRPTGLMVLDRNCQRFRNCCHGEIMTTRLASRNIFLRAVPDSRSPSLDVGPLFRYFNLTCGQRLAQIVLRRRVIHQARRRRQGRIAS